ncbi:glycosyltransferase family 2 protein [Cereibacter sediminicola]|uniref:glycosyltransferase family 2 protein n=1 Tax=Cereibacter sediminicola TaxID=2584941 RepID=UPI0011A43E52|nr:glycosyltransferase [Cereibacter sediminicola]
MPKPEPQVSIIVCTRNRPEGLLRTVRSICLAAEHHPDLPVEILVVENGSAPDRRLEANEIASLSGGRARLLRLKTGGLSAARNAGIAAAWAPILAFTDDDCLLDPDWLADLDRHLAARPRETLYIGGRVVLGDAEDLPFTVKDLPDRQRYDGLMHPGGFIPGCNFAVSREVIERIGTFDTSLGAGARFRAGEDTDFTIRAHLAGVAAEYVPDMRVSHHHGRRRIEDIRRLNRAYAFSNGVLYLRYWRQRWLVRQFYWALRAALAEGFGGPRYDPIGLSWRSVVAGNLAGMVAQLGSGFSLPHLPLRPMPRLKEKIR